MTINPVKAIEQNIKQAKLLVDMGTSMARLRNNADFKKVIMNGYFEQEAIRLVHLKADISMQSADCQKSIGVQMDAIGSFSQYLNTVQYKADLASKAISADEETRDEILAEELNND